MHQMNGWILAAGLIVAGGARSHGQMPQELAEMQKSMAEMQQAQESLMKEAAPELYAFQERLRGIEAQIGKIAAKLAKDEIDKESARKEMLPLIRQQQQIQDDPEFLVAQRLAQALLSSRKYQEKMEKLMRALGDKQRSQR